MIRNKKSIHLLCAFVLVILQFGCASPQQEELYRGIYNVQMNTDAKPYAVYLSKYPQLDSLKIQHLYYACFAFYQERNYAAFDDCANRFLPLTGPDQPWVPFPLHTNGSWASYDPAELTGTKAEARAMLLTWSSLMQLDVENLKGAKADINEAVRLIEEETENPTVESAFLFNPFRYPLRFIKVEVYRAYGIIQSRMQNTEEAKFAINTIRDQSVVLRESDLRKLKNAYAAHVYLALNDFPSANAELETYSGMSAEQLLLSGVLFALSAGGSGLLTSLEAGAAGIATVLPGNDPFLAKFLVAKISYEEGDMPGSKQAYQQLLENDKIEQYPNLHFVVLHDLAKILESENDHKGAIALLKKSVDVIEAKRKTINSEGSKIGFIGNKQDIYHSLIVLLIKEGQNKEAFAYVERSKARAMVDLLASKREFSSKQVNQADITELLSQIDQLEQQPVKLAKEGTRGLKLIKQKVLAADKEVSSLTTVNSIGSDEIQQLLPQGETLVEYYGLGDDLFAFIVDRNDVHVVLLNGDGLDSAISDFRQWIQNPKSLQKKTTKEMTGQALYTRLIKPLESHIKNTNLTIVPHGSLHYLPFAALQSRNKYLLERYSFRVLPSASVMEFLNKSTAPKTGSTLIFGNPNLNDSNLDLPYAQLEAQKIGKLMSGATVLTRNQATETAAKTLGGSYKYIHFASHGVFDPEAPLSSALLLSKDGSNDGRLTVGELYETRMDADLVTLSACETALGKIANGDDVVGFTRGFLYAGANSIVSSLWKVDDEATSILMYQFYQNLAKMDKRTALRKAQLAMISSNNSHPFYWSAFQLTGMQ